MADKEGSGKSFLYKDFDARRNIYEKVITTPRWFDIEEYAFAWSTSIRNHNFLFTNTEQIEKNKEKTEVVNNKLYSRKVRSVHFWNQGFYFKYIRIRWTSS